MTTKPDILVAYPYRPAEMAVLEEQFTLHRLDQAASGAERDALLADVGGKCSVLICNGHVHIDKAMLDKLPALKLVANSSAGFEPMDYPEMQRRGIALTNTSAALLNDVADMAVLLMLAARRRLIEADAYVRSGDWGRKGMFPLTRAASGKKVGIVGLGTIGKAIAKRCEVLGMDIGYFARTAKPDVSYPFFATPLALAGWADVLIVATPGGRATEGLISADVLAALGVDGTLVNIARGTVVDEAALISALQNGGIASAGLDVFLNEPAPPAALTALPNVVLYPHHASGTIETREKMSRLALDNVLAFFAGKPLLTPV